MSIYINKIIKLCLIIVWCVLNANASKTHQRFASEHKYAKTTAFAIAFAFFFLYLCITSPPHPPDSTTGKQQGFNMCQGASTSMWEAPDQRTSQPMCHLHRKG